MPLTIPQLDDRHFVDLREEALARIPVHTPEWTNFNRSDPGVTLIEIFAFMTENLLYRSNQIPERNRRAFLRLLGVPLQPASSARGLVAFSNTRGPATTITLNDGLEVFAGDVPFRTMQGLDVLPVEGRAYYKRATPLDDEQLKAYYRELYASYQETPPDETSIQLYETTPLAPRDERGVNLSRESVDGAVWIALLARVGTSAEAARKEIAGKTLNLGIVPSLINATEARLLPSGAANPEADALLLYELPKVPAGGVLLPRPDRVPRYQPLEARAWTDVLAEPGVVELTLPGNADQLQLWSNLDPLEAGVGDFPPALEDTALNDRLITWLRVRPAVALRPSSALNLQLLWVGINAAMVSQRAAVVSELLPDGTGEPDQTVRLARAPIIPGSVRLTVAPRGGEPQPWTAIDDLAGAGPEVLVPDQRQPPGAVAAQQPSLPSEVFVVDYEAGVIRFGDGYRGKRPPLGARLRASYDYGVGQDGNVGARSVSKSPALPARIDVANPVRTWNGADAETTEQGEKQVARYLQHRDRLVSAADFATIVWRAPGVAIGRVEVLPAFHPDLSPNEPGDAPGAVTLLLIPSYDPLQPDAPLPDRLFLDTICAYLDPRRLVTTEVVLRGPTYKPIWISVGIDVVSGTSVAQVREAVKRELLQFLAPKPANPRPDAPDHGWPLRKAVADRELMAVANRVPNVLLVNGLLLAEGAGGAVASVPMRSLELPRVMGISVTIGDPLDLAQLRGEIAGAGATPAAGSVIHFLPVPVIPEECR